MKISFKKPELTDLAFSLYREWIELEDNTNYASSTILGLNTRKKHGLFLIFNKPNSRPFLLLSHLQEELFIDNQSHPLYNVEYENQAVFAGLKYLEKCELDPFPTFFFFCDNVWIEKSFCLLHNKSQLIIRYQIRGDVPAGSRLVVRPFFAFRSIDECTNPEHFENTEAFIMDQQFRFLPNPELPEVFMQYSTGQFINAPVWYHNFVYRHDYQREKKTEDLLNPGFFEYFLEKNNSLYLSITLHQADPAQLAILFEHEKEKRSLFLKAHNKRSEPENFLFGKISHFQNVYLHKNRLFGTDLFDKSFYLSLHCLIISRLLQSGIERSEIHKYYESLIALLKNNNLEELFQGMNKEIKIDPATPFFVIFFLYHYHLQNGKGDEVLASLEIMLQILELIRKDKLIFYKFKSNKLLERRYRKSDLEPKSDYEIFYPLRQNFILNIFWYNALNMVMRLAELKKLRVKRYPHWVKKIKQRFYNQFVRGLIANPYQANERFGFAFHPAMIYALTFPFPLLEEKPAQIFYRLLIKQFLIDTGIKFPIVTKDLTKYITSPILIGDYLDGWEKIMKDKEFLLGHFQAVAKNFKEELSRGVIGYIPYVLNPEQANQTGKIDRPSGIASTEVLYFLHRLNQITKK